MRNIKSFLIFIVFLINGCISQIVSIEEATKHWIGKPIEEKRKLVLRKESYASRINWKEKTYTLENGNWVYVQPNNINCFIHWEVNPQGIIVDYTLEGVCR